MGKEQIDQIGLDFEKWAQAHGLNTQHLNELYRSHVVAWMRKSWRAAHARYAGDREALLRQLNETTSALEAERYGLGEDNNPFDCDHVIAASKEMINASLAHGDTVENLKRVLPGETWTNNLSALLADSKEGNRNEL